MRRLDWPERMNDALDAARGRSFSQLYHCCVFAADVVLAMTNADPLTADERAAGSVDVAYALMRATHASLGDALADRLGGRIPVAFASRGDVVLRTDGSDEAVGVCCGETSAFITSDGLEFYRTLDMAEAFSVP